MPIPINSFRDVGILTSAFLSDQADFSASRVLAAVLARHSKKYDGPVQSLPLPDDVPENIPRVILQSKDKTWQFLAAQRSITSLWRGTVPSLGDEQHAITKECAAVLEYVVDELGLSVGRLGLVISRRTDVSDPAEELVRHFCNEWAQNKPFRRNLGFEIHNHKRYQPQYEGSLMINSWVRCKAVRARQNAITVEQDLNTLVEESIKKRFSSSDMKVFFSEICLEGRSILNLYFTGSDGGQ